VGSGSGSGSGSGKGPDGDAPSVGLRATHDALKRAHATEIQVTALPARLSSLPAPHISASSRIIFVDLEMEGNKLIQRNFVCLLL
jgi:hypothetical protein